MLPFRKASTALAGDKIQELIELWKAIRDDPAKTACEYERRWQRLRNEGHTAYYDIRDSFNRTRDPHDLLFLSRTCVNGLIRFNVNREFNNSLHHTRPGISPERFRTLVIYWSNTIKNVDFVHCDYKELLSDSRPNDVIFLDPPYSGTRGRYVPDDFNIVEFFSELEILNRTGAKWALTLDGNAGSRIYNSCIPAELYKQKLTLFTGNSPFTKMMRTGKDAVMESVYLNFEPPVKLTGYFLNQPKKNPRLAHRLQMEQCSLFSGT